MRRDFVGLFDSVMVPCPHCGKPAEVQSKADDECYMRTFTLDTAPPVILSDIMNRPEHCMSCDGWFALVDPAYPPGHVPKPQLRVAAVRTPYNPRTHFQGFKWWPDNEPFTYADLIEPVE
jgi:hypothetical protein